jgi:hypothetical protein
MDKKLCSNAIRSLEGTKVDKINTKKEDGENNRSTT